MVFRIKIEPEAYQDIQEGIFWYNKRQPGLGRRFHTEVKASFKTIRENPFFRIRYDDVRCLPLKKYPFIIHYTVDEDEKKLIIRAVFNTSMDPGKWKKR
jgi:hypothetical protein